MGCAGRTADADALGSALALGLALRQRGITVRVTFGEPANAPESRRGLDVASLIVSPDEVPAAPNLLIAMNSRANAYCTSGCSIATSTVRSFLVD